MFSVLARTTRTARTARPVAAGTRREGPLVVVANHPPGRPVRTMFGLLLPEARGGEVGRVAPLMFRRAPELDQRSLPIDVSETAGAAGQYRDPQTGARIPAVGRCKRCVPGHGLAPPNQPFSETVDRAWRPFPARTEARSAASELPVFSAGGACHLINHPRHMSNFRLPFPAQRAVALGAPRPDRAASRLRRSQGRSWIARDGAPMRARPIRSAGKRRVGEWARVRRDPP